MITKINEITKIDGRNRNKDEQDFLDSKEGQRPGVNIRRYRNNGLYIALMCAAILAGDDLRDEDWVPKKARKKL